RAVVWRDHHHDASAAPGEASCGHRSSPGRGEWMEAFLVSTGVVALAELGDQTPLLSLVLAARFRRPWAIVLGILVATLVNHALAGAAGAWIAGLVAPTVLRWALALSFVAMGAWALVPDRIDDQDVRASHTGV